MDEETTRDFLANNDRSDLKKLLAKLKQKYLNARIKYDPAYATSPICISDKDYDFSVDPKIITLVESDIATLITHEEKSRYYYILKLFPFSLKGDSKICFNSLALGCMAYDLLLL